MGNQPYVVPVALRWGDMDAYGHVNNATMLRLIEEARVRAIRDLWGPNGLTDIGILVARIEIDYLAPLDYRADPVPVALWVSHLGGASFSVSCEVADPDAVYARALVTLVTYDFATSTPVRVPADKRGVLEQLLADEVELRRQVR